MQNRSNTPRYTAVFRVDSSTQIGTGHVMRCLTLAEQLRQAGRESLFVCRDLPGSLCSAIERHRFGLCRLPSPKPASISQSPPVDQYAAWLGVSWSEDAQETLQAIESSACKPDLLVIDHYGLDHRWEDVVRPAVGQIMVIDDLANRRHNCDLLLDQNLFNNMHVRYLRLVPKDCLTLLGPAYALLRPEFEIAYRKMARRDGSVNRILVFLGGADPTNETTKALQGIQILGRPDIAVDVVAGEHNPHRAALEGMISGMPSATFHCQVSNIAELMAAANLAIGAGGTTTWERCYLGLPSLIMVLAQNQKEVAEAAGKAGAAWNLGWAHTVSSDIIARALTSAVDHPEEVLAVSRKAEQLMHAARGDCDQTLLSTILSVAVRR